MEMRVCCCVGSERKMRCQDQVREGKVHVRGGKDPFRGGKEQGKG